MAERDYYEMLGVSASSEHEVIEAAYRALMRKYHPDRQSSGPLDLNKAREINLAYETLGDPRRRMEYNRSRGTSAGLPSTELVVPTSTRESPIATERTNEVKRCIECDEDIRPQARVCRFCGASQFGHARAAGQTTNVHTHVYPSPQPPLEAKLPEKRETSCLTIAFWTFAVVAVLILIGFMTPKQGDTSENAANSTNASAASAFGRDQPVTGNFDFQFNSSAPDSAPAEAVEQIPEPPSDQTAAGRTELNDGQGTVAGGDTPAPEGNASNPVNAM